MTASIVILILWLVFFGVVFGQDKIMRYFNLVDKRMFVDDKETYQKLNKIMSAGDISLYRHEISSKPYITLSVKYDLSKSESNEIRVSGDSLSGVIKTSYEAAVAKGFIKKGAK